MTDPVTSVAITAQIFCAFYLTGVIWVIQLIHYPAFAMITEADFAAFHRRHSSVMTVLVGPVMLIELGTAGWLARALEWPWVLNLVSVALPFVSTFALSVPRHDRLGRATDPATLRSLVTTNWIRTLSWSARAAAYLGYLLTTGAH